MITSISVVIMAFNEVETLESVFMEVESVVGKLCPDYEILIIDDGSTDGSGEVADRLMDISVHGRVIHHPKNQGMGGVYRTGFRQARKDGVYFMAADGQSHPGKYLPEFLPLLNTYDIVLGQFVRRKDPLLSRFFSFLEKCLFQALFPGVPKLGGPCLFRRNLLIQTPLYYMKGEDRSWIVLWEFLIRSQRKGCRIATRDAERRPRLHGVSKGNTWRNAWSMLYAAFRLRLILLMHPTTV